VWYSVGLLNLGDVTDSMELHGYPGPFTQEVQNISTRKCNAKPVLVRGRLTCCQRTRGCQSRACQLKFALLLVKVFFLSALKELQHLKSSDDGINKTPGITRIVASYSRSILQILPTIRRTSSSSECVWLMTSDVYLMPVASYR